MVTYPQFPQPQFQAPMGGTPASSGAVVINITNPQNFPNATGPVGMGGLGGAQPAGMFGPGAAGPSAFPANYYNAGGFPMAASPQQALQNAYQEALNARSVAEQKLSDYMNMGRTLDQTAYAAQQPWMNQAQPNPWAQQGYQNANFFPPQPFPQQFPPQPFPQQFPPQPFPPQPDMNQVPPQPPVEQPQEQVPPGMVMSADGPIKQEDAIQTTSGAVISRANAIGLADGRVLDKRTATVDDLNAAIDKPSEMQWRVNAMEEAAIRQAASPKTFELLQREALADTSHLKSDPVLYGDAEYTRSSALWTLGLLNASQNASVPAANLPGLKVFDQIIRDRNENPDVKIAAVQGLQALGPARVKDKTIQKILQRASKDKNPAVAKAAKAAMSGQPILPGPGMQMA